MRRRANAGAVLAIAAIALFAIPAAASARDFTVTSFDGTKISAHFFDAAGLPAGQKAPTVMIGPGWSQSGETDPNSSGNPVLANFGVTPIGAFVHHGYNVVTWDPRGFGASQGTVQVDDYRYEGRDAQALIDYIAQQPEAQMESGSDPLLGMAGASYGGIIQLVTAAIDSRVDAIVPNITPHDYTSSLFKERAVKAGWGLILVGAGLEGGTLPGLIGPNPNLDALDPHILSTIPEAVTDNTVSNENYQWFADKGPGFLVKNIHVPTLLTQGTADTLFTLQEAIENYNDLEAHSGAPLKMMWFCGGHGVCTTPSGQPADYVTQRTLGWLDRYLKNDSTVDTGPRFEWLADDGVWRSAANYPLKSAGTLSAQGSAAMLVSPGGLSGLLIASTPLPVPGIAAQLPIPGPSTDSDVVGAPQLTLTYSGTAVKPHTIVYAQIADPANFRVLGNVTTPIPLELDGQTHTVSRPLEPIALRALANHNYELEIVPYNNLYGPQLNLGVANFSDMKVDLPVVDAAGTAPPPQPVVAAKKKRSKKSKRAMKRCLRKAKHAKHPKRAKRHCLKSR